MLPIPTGEEGDHVERKIRLGSVLKYVFSTVAIVVNHCGATVLHGALPWRKPIASAYHSYGG